MPKVIFLGSSDAIPSRERENTHFVIVGQTRIVLVDSPNNQSILRLQQAGVDFHDLTDLIVTHFHPDHTLGIPALLLNMWILGRKRPLNLYGLPFTLDRVQAMLNLYDWTTWDDFYPVHFIPISADQLSPTLTCPDFTLLTSPVQHAIPNIGLRVNFKSGQSFAYSCDTKPCEAVVRLGAGADVLVHEAGGDFAGHSSPRQAGEIAARANAARLLLIHYSTRQLSGAELVAEASAAYTGEVALAEDFMTLAFGSP
ncbi:MAG: ribonuclease Z [Anaerolineales bacterium]|nr:ribonuclease Z [Anaerolineales bacterium]